ncbi:hypothetical protein PoB_003984400 [Plakobranchus ocellatus]|uniref:Uncharacterized protein n=1 Tax=Plakobranchus ocellatus TaxID=259542 RepID=A0AAV4B007_9GAST|nr:hypothetical protein PoB_003984400 [Plakobranchus ocellatus]
MPVTKTNIYMYIFLRCSIGPHRPGPEAGDLRPASDQLQASVWLTPTKRRASVGLAKGQRLASFSPASGQRLASFSPASGQRQAS